MNVRVSGFRREGSWSDIVEHAHQISRALIRARVHEGPYEGALEEYDRWRPRKGEVVDELEDRTIEQASITKGEGEENGVGVREDLADAGRKLGGAAGQAKEKDASEALRKLGASAKHASRAADTASRRAMRSLEEGLYRHVMTRISPYYFDNALVSANLEQLGSDRFMLEVNVKEDDLKDAVTKDLQAEHAGEDTVDA